MNVIAAYLTSSATGIIGTMHMSILNSLNCLHCTKYDLFWNLFSNIIWIWARLFHKISDNKTRICGRKQTCQPPVLVVKTTDVRPKYLVDLMDILT
jgi:hypothetical protein